MTEEAPFPVLAIVNARVWTNDPRRPWADGVLVRGEHLLAVGSSAELRKRAGAGATVIDAGGRLVVPNEPDGRLVAGGVANLSIVDRAPSAAPGEAVPERDVVLSLRDGRIVMDRRWTST
jgi:predicted amidohydrolase YtcJ